MVVNSSLWSSTFHLRGRRTFRRSSTPSSSSRSGSSFQGVGMALKVCERAGVGKEGGRLVRASTGSSSDVWKFQIRLRRLVGRCRDGTIRRFSSLAGASGPISSTVWSATPDWAETDFLRECRSSRGRTGERRSGCSHGCEDRDRSGRSGWSEGGTASLQHKEIMGYLPGQGVRHPELERHVEPRNILRTGERDRLRSWTEASQLSSRLKIRSRRFRPPLGTSRTHRGVRPKAVRPAIRARKRGA